MDRGIRNVRDALHDESDHLTARIVARPTLAIHEGAQLGEAFLEGLGREQDPLGVRIRKELNADGLAATISVRPAEGEGERVEHLTVGLEQKPVVAKAPK